MEKEIVLGLELMLKGMLGIFCVSFILIFIIVIMNAVTKIMKKEDKS